MLTLAAGKKLTNDIGDLYASWGYAGFMLSAESSVEGMADPLETVKYVCTPHPVIIAKLRTGKPQARSKGVVGNGLA
jgi:hypothetical protein